MAPLTLFSFLWGNTAFGSCRTSCQSSLLPATPSAGAVEQLNTHVRNLRSLTTDAANPSITIELFQKGYGKDAAGIAKEAITYAKSNHFDVVLVDTAGRMQDNEPLMRALAKLVKINNPNKVFFVGEALVGNDGVDQLVKFNQALKDFSDLAEPRQIDGIVLTKFDTIDDKVERPSA